VTVRFVDDRLGLSRWARTSLRKVFPEHWSFMLGEVALFSFVTLVATGIYLTFFFDASQARTTYHGSYRPLRGTGMSRAYESVIHTSFDVRAGLLIRQIHHWAALVFVAAILAHLCRVFFTGAFRRPREINWIVGVTLLILAIVNGFAGYSLLDDLLSGTGLRIAYSIVLSIPIVGGWAASLLFGGPFPGTRIISRLFVFHVLVVPAIIVALLSLHLAILWHQKHTQFRGPGKREDNVVGTRLWPAYAARSVGLLLLMGGILTGLGALVQVNPVWLYGPSDPAAVTTAAQPDWYMGWLEGALRLAGPWRVHIFGHTISEVFWPAVVLPGLTFVLLYAWPFLEAWVTRDRSVHHLLDRPRDRPVRTAIGVGVLTFNVVLFVGGSQDIIAQKLNWPIDRVLFTLRVLLVVLPLTFGAFAWRLASDLRAASPPDPPSIGPPARRPQRPEPTPSRGVVVLGRTVGVASLVAAVLDAFRSRRRR
jgi:ubiquinol-cytochrome c reductase cytochrome b subunit